MRLNFKIYSNLEFFLCPQLKKLKDKEQEPVTEEEMAAVAKKVFTFKLASIFSTWAGVLLD